MIADLVLFLVKPEVVLISAHTHQWKIPTVQDKAITTTRTAQLEAILHIIIIVQWITVLLEHYFPIPA